jgi:hypothetical protein
VVALLAANGSVLALGPDGDLGRYLVAAAAEARLGLDILPECPEAARQSERTRRRHDDNGSSGDVLVAAGVSGDGAFLAPTYRWARGGISSRTPIVSAS